MTHDDRDDDKARRLQLLEAKLVAVTRARDVVDIAAAAATSKLAVQQVMRAFSLGEEQAIVVLDSPFRDATQAARAAVEQEIRELRKNN